MQKLLEPIKLNDLQLNNRIFMAPLTRNRADNDELAPTDLHVEYYKQRAGAGLIISEGSQVSPMGVGYIYTPGIYSDAQVEGWSKVTEAVHKEGGKIFIQIWHVGRVSHPEFLNGKLPLAPSAINPISRSKPLSGLTKTVTPKEMSIDEIKQTINEFKIAAKNSWAAGFDGIEIHSSNGYLFQQFFNKCSNIREDEYGGSIENRARFLFEVIEEIKEVMPEERIALRLNPSANGFHGMKIDEETIPTFDYIINKLNDYKLSYLHLSEPFSDVTNVPFAETNIAQRYRPIYKGNLVINNNFTRDAGNKVIEDGLADAVAYGKLFISNPDLVKRFELNASLNEWDSETFYTQGSKGFTDYPSLDQQG